MTNPRAIFNDELPWYLKCAGTEAELAAMDEAEEVMYMVDTVWICGVKLKLDIPKLINLDQLVLKSKQELDDQ